MQCQDVKNIVKCFLFRSFHARIKDVSFSSMSCRYFVRHQDIYICISKGHCKWVKPSTADRSKVRRLANCGRVASDPRHHTLAKKKTPLLHPSPTIQPAVIAPLSHTLSPERGGGQELSRCSHPAAAFLSLTFCFSFEDVLCSLFFFLFFIEKYYCSSLPSVCNLLIIPRLL